MTVCEWIKSVPVLFHDVAVLLSQTLFSFERSLHKLVHDEAEKNRILSISVLYIKLCLTSTSGLKFLPQILHGA